MEKNEISRTPIKHILLSFTKQEHKRLKKIKGKRKWEDIMIAGIIAIENEK